MDGFDCWNYFASSKAAGNIFTKLGMNNNNWHPRPPIYTAGFVKKLPVVSELFNLVLTVKMRMRLFQMFLQKLQINARELSN